MLEDRITEVNLERDDKKTLCVYFKIDGIVCLEWIKVGRDGVCKVERTDSHLKCHYVGDIDVEEIHDFLDSQISN